MKKGTGWSDSHKWTVRINAEKKAKKHSSVGWIYVAPDDPLQLPRAIGASIVYHPESMSSARKFREENSSAPDDTTVLWMMVSVQAESDRVL